VSGSHRLGRAGETDEDDGYDRGAGLGEYSRAGRPSFEVLRRWRSPPRPGARRRESPNSTSKAAR
jgi:hypothetical protein